MYAICFINVHTSQYMTFLFTRWADMCKPHQIRCLSSNGCANPCNGISECPGGEDEKGCNGEYIHPPNTMYWFRLHRCIFLSQLLIIKKTFADFWIPQCLYIIVKTVETVINGRYRYVDGCTYRAVLISCCACSCLVHGCTCAPGLYACKDGMTCLPADKVCDGVGDCPNRDDEAACGRSIFRDIFHLCEFSGFRNVLL